MTKDPYIDVTLPSVVGDLEGRYSRPQMLLTIVFHPEVDRIGQVCTIPADGGGQPWILGRGRAGFCAPGGETASGGSSPLGDPHVSRKALLITRRKKRVVLTRASDACRIRVNDSELVDDVGLDEQQLAAGVAILLANRVLLLLRELPDTGNSAAGGVVQASLKGSSHYMQDLRRQVATVAASGRDVLIRGETGTGKELVAEAIHANSPQTGREMVTVNMSAIPPSLAPAALFGSIRGAYTGADTASKGYFERAQGGILFLDEVGDTPAEVQTQLLRALQQREIQSVGGGLRKVDLRVIAATDAPLDECPEFKAALRYRLANCEIVLRPLREHPEDIGELLWYFLERYLGETGANHVLPGPHTPEREIASWADLFHAFLRFSWPGNIRQLSNFVSQVAMASAEMLVLPENLREDLRGNNKSKGKAENKSRSKPAVEEKRRHRKIEDVRPAEFLSAMEEARYEAKAAACILNISRTAVYRLIERTSQLRLAHQIPLAEVQRVLSSCGGDITKAAMQLRVSSSSLRSRLRASDAIAE